MAVNFKIGSSYNNENPSTWANTWIRVEGAPGSITTVIDVNCGSSGYMTVFLTTDRHIFMQGTFFGTVYSEIDIAGGAQLDIGQWYWVSSGHGSRHNSESVLNTVKPVGGVWDHAGVNVGTAESGTNLANLPDHTTIVYNAAVGFGVHKASSYADNPSDGTVLSFSKPEFFEQNCNAFLVGPPTADRVAASTYLFYDCRQTLGSAASLTDSGSAGVDLSPGPNGLVITHDGPYAA